MDPEQNMLELCYTLDQHIALQCSECGKRINALCRNAKVQQDMEELHEGD